VAIKGRAWRSEGAEGTASMTFRVLGRAFT
jgi:hypothetical protein